MDIENIQETDIKLDEVKEALINHVCTENKTFFKHQQINEHEIDENEKKNIVLGILNNSHSRFLSRFGMVLRKEHLEYFESQIYSDNDQKELIFEQIKQLKYSLDHKRTIVKNRRYAAMIKLIEDNEYFSDQEMERRNPLLYHDLVGKYLSPAEIAKKRRPNAEINTLVDVLLEKIDHDKTCEHMKRQQELEDDDSNQSLVENNVEETDIESNQPQWGNFDDEKNKSDDGKTKRRKRNANLLITANERDMLHDEFLGIMYNDFLMGRDTEYFDYSQVDSNADYDDILENDQDCQDRYFDEESQEIDITQQNIENTINEIHNESEDELDIYMKHIQDHIKRQKKEAFQEEFDD